MQQDVTQLQIAITRMGIEPELSQYMRKHGSLKQIFLTGKFQRMFTLWDNTVAIAPIDELQLALQDGFISVEDFEMVQRVVGA